jgi:hypothetical protein
VKAIIFIVLGILCLSVFAVAASPILGTWQGETEGQPSVILTVIDNRGKLDGTVVFNVLQKEGDKFKVVNGHQSALLNPNLDGKLFKFDIQDPNDPSGKATLSFEMRLTGNDEGVLKNVDEDTAAPPVTMKRKAEETK